MITREKLLWYAVAAVVAIDVGYLLIAERPIAPFAAMPPGRPLLAEAPKPNPALAGEPVVLGAVLPLSGEHAAVGKNVADALRMAVDGLNATTGIGGRPARLVIEDGGCATTTARAAAGRLLKEKPAAIFPICSAETLAVAARTAGAGILILSPSASADAVSRAGPEVFRLVPPDAVAKDATARYRRDHPGPFDLRPYFDGRAERAENFFRSYKARFGGDPLPPWYLANAYSAVFLIKDLTENHGGDPRAWPAALVGYRHWSGGALDDLAFDRNGDPVWTRFVVSETRDGARIDDAVVEMR